MPPPTSVPSGTFVDELCGQPEQKYGVRASSGAEMRSRRRARREASAGGRSWRRRRALAAAAPAGGIDRWDALGQPAGQPGRDGVRVQFAPLDEERAAGEVLLAGD